MTTHSPTTNPSCRNTTEITTLTDRVSSIIDSFATRQDKVDAVLDQVTEDWIIHIDDEQELTQALRIKLENRGLRVMLAEDGKAGVRRTFLGLPKAIILDFEMPNGNGDTVLETLKSNRLTKDIPVIVLSGKNCDELTSQMLRLGATAVFKKPYDFEELYQAIKGSIS